MHVIAKKALRTFWKRHPDAERPLKRWFRTVSNADWASFSEMRATYAAADQVGKLTVFDIGGNKYRLIAAIHFNRGKLFIRHVLTHAEYDLGDWKKES